MHTKTQHAAYRREWRKTHKLTEEQKIRDRCRSYTNVYKQRGLLEVQRCVVCGDKAEAHHEDYTKPLDVVWLCRKHHKQRHQDKN